jgi:hypothetical protein
VSEFPVRKTEEFHVGDGFAPFPETEIPFEQVAMPLMTIADGQLQGVGTGFMISPDGLMITAVHVIEDGIRRGTKKTNADGSVEIILGFYALYNSNRKHGESNEYFGGLLPISKVFYSGMLDIGFCLLNRPIIGGQPLKFPVLPLSPGIPKVGEYVLGIGYYGMKGEIVPQTGDSKPVIKYAERTALTTGQITEVYPVKRDMVMAPWPCLRTDARFEHGMSGGPIINEHGGVCGVICSAVSGIEDSEGYISFGSLLWLALGTELEVALGVGAKPEKVSLYDLIQKGYVGADETIANVEVVMEPSGKRTVHVR